MRTIYLYVMIIFTVSMTISESSGSESKYQSKYVGQEKREIKSLSKQDIKELKAGSGWGLAKAAELNGMPGPKHILDMKREIELSSDQEKRIEKIFEKMNKEAVQIGEELIELERELNHRFANRTIDKKSLRVLLHKIATTYEALRFVHLSAHLETPKILSSAQIDKYNNLRGYTSDDPCKNIPEGHDPEMWKRHHNCP